jgi:hypothetical protein
MIIRLGKKQINVHLFYVFIGNANGKGYQKTYQR